MGMRANRGRSDKIPNKKLLQNKDVIRHNCASIRARSTFPSAAELEVGCVYAQAAFAFQTKI